MILDVCPGTSVTLRGPEGSSGNLAGAQVEAPEQRL